MFEHLDLLRASRLEQNTVVATVMSNFGLEVALRDAGVRLVRTEVGDPAVAREMRQNSYNLGGEQSGHVIFMDHSTTGDGLISALMVLAILAESGRPLSELRAMRFPISASDRSSSRQGEYPAVDSIRKTDRARLSIQS